MRDYVLHAPGAELVFRHHDLACDVCAGLYTVAGVIGPGARGLRSSPARLEAVERRGGWPCSCADVSAGVRVGLPPATP